MRRTNFLLVSILVFLTACSASQIGQPTVSQTQIRVPVASEQTIQATPSRVPATESLVPKSTPTMTLTSEITATPPVCQLTQGRIDQEQLLNERLNKPIAYRIYLPPCYDQMKDMHYPVLYLIHGQSYTEDQWDRLGVDETADRLIASGELPPFLIVMPGERGWDQPPKDTFGEELYNELIPWIDTTYRTIPARQFRVIGGLSRGASWALHLGLSHPETFGAIGLHSLPVFWTDLNHIKRWLTAIPADSTPRIYLDLGDRDSSQISKSARWFEELLTQMDIPHEWHLYTGYHEEAYWQAHLEDYLRWYGQEW